MSRRPYQTLFAESTGWIRQHPNATAHDVPNQLLELWICESEDPETPTGFQLSVFAFGYFQQQLTKSNGRELEIPTTELIKLFQLWQLKLGLAEVERLTELKVFPMALFDFPENETVKCCHR